MFDRALSLRRKLLRAIKVHLGLAQSNGLPRKPDAVTHKSDNGVLGLDPTGDRVPEMKYTSVRPESGVNFSSLPSAVRTTPDTDVVSLRELASNSAVTIVVSPVTVAPVPSQSPLATPEKSSSERAGPSRTGPNPADSQEFAEQVEMFQRMQQQLQRTAITRTRSMPLSVSDPMRKLRDSYVRIMHKMAQDEAKENRLSSSSALVVASDHPPVFDYLYRRRSPADEEEEEFCRLAVMRTKFSRSQSAL